MFGTKNGTAGREGGALVNRRQFGLWGAAALGGLAFGLPGQAVAQAGDESLTLAYGALGAGRHPWQSAVIADFDIVDLIFDPLLSMDADQNIIPVLAESYEVVSPERLHFVLREGASFHDGRPVTSKDVKFSLEAALDTRATLGIYYRPWLDHVEIIDDRTFDVVAKHPYRLAANVLSFVSPIYPEGTDFDNYTNLIGAGPYRFVEYVPNDRVVVERFDGYYGNAPKYARITIRQISEGSTRVAALIAGEVDFADGIAVEDIPLVESGGKKVLTTPTNRLMYFGFNRTGDTPVQNALVRKAINYAIDNEAIREAIFSGLGAQATSIVPPHMAYYADDLERYAYDPEKARALLAEAGFADGFDLVIAGPNNRYIRDRETCEIVTGMLSDVGIRATLQLFDWSTYFAELSADRDNKSGKYGLFLWAWAPNPPDAEAAFGSLISGSPYNMAGFDNPDFMSKLRSLDTMSDPEDLRKTFAELQVLVWNEEAQFAAILFTPMIVGVSDKLADHKVAPNELSHWNRL